MSLTRFTKLHCLCVNKRSLNYSDTSRYRTPSGPRKSVRYRCPSPTSVPNSFINTFKRVDDAYPISTRSAFTGQLVVPSYNTTRYGLNSIYKKCIDSWNMITSEINNLRKWTVRSTYSRCTLEMN